MIADLQVHVQLPEGGGAFWSVADDLEAETRRGWPPAAPSFSVTVAAGSPSGIRPTWLFCATRNLPDAP